MSSPAANSTLRDFYRQEFDRLRAEFETTGSGVAAVTGRAQLLDTLVSDLWRQHVVPRLAKIHRLFENGNSRGAK